MTYRYDPPDNLVTLFEASVRKFSKEPLFGTKTTAGDYEWVTYGQVGERVDHLRGGLAHVGVQPGDAVGIIADNCAEWAVCAFATYGLGARYIPMYEQELPQTWQYIINDGDVRVLFVSSSAIRDRIEALNDAAPRLEAVVQIEGHGEHSMAALEQTGRSHHVPAACPGPHDIAVLIYTSGTTGKPKGVLLSHGNFTTNVKAGGARFPELGQGSRSLSILPWAHSFGQTAELYNFIQFGGSIGFVGDVTTLAEDMAKVRPTFLIAVPRVFNKIHDNLQAKIDATGSLAKKLFVMGMQNARKRREMAVKGQTDWLLDLKVHLADKLVFNKIRKRFGGRLSGAVTGSATMNVEICNFFFDLGIPVYDCYGLTETSPAVTMNCPAAHRPGSVGRPIDQVTLKIDPSILEAGAEDGEIIVYGPNVMHGYHNQPEATRAVMTADGGLRTGDRGRLDPEGFLFITGRIKEQYKLENGKYVFPAAIEEEIKLLAWVENAMIYGEGRPFNICLVVPDFNVLVNYGRARRLAGSPDQWIAHAGLQEMIAEAITGLLAANFGGYEIPRKFLWLRENFSLENGTLTQTMKLKRRHVIERYRDRIEALYAQRDDAWDSTRRPDPGLAPGR